MILSSYLDHVDLYISLGYEVIEITLVYKLCVLTYSRNHRSHLVASHVLWFIGGLSCVAIGGYRTANVKQ